MKLVVITGQTATGKTDLALEFASKENGELINCDSRQIYTHLNIITGKGDEKIWLYDIVTPDQYFSSFDYTQRAIPAIRNILNRGKTPVLVGGTYLYIKHLLYSVETERIAPDWDLRKRYTAYSVEKLQNELKTIDADFFNLLNESEKQNPQRLIRKIEIAIHRKSVKATKPVSSNVHRNSQDVFRSPYQNTNISMIGLKHKTRDSLAAAIKQRVGTRIQQGAFEEVRSLLKKGYTEQDPGMKTIGYRQIIKYLRGLCTKEQAVEEWITKEIHYAKRQYTFMKKDKNIAWKEV